MILDTSAIIAIIAQEDEAPAMIRAIKQISPDPLIVAAPTLFETFIALHHRRGSGGRVALERFKRDIGLLIEPFHSHLTELACEAYERYRHGKTGLNFGDCFSYALAKARGEPLLCKGNDFRQTDIALVEY